VRAEDRSALGTPSRIVHAVGFDVIAAPVQASAIGQIHRLLAFGRQQRSLDELPERAESGVLVLRTGQRTQVERGQMPHVPDRHVEQLAQRQRELRTGHAAVEQLALQQRTGGRDALGLAAQQPRHHQHRAAVQTLVRIERRIGEMPLVRTDRQDARGALARAEAGVESGQRRMQRPARTQQLSLVVDRADANQIQLGDVGKQTQQIGGERVAVAFGAGKIERGARRRAGELAFDRQCGGAVERFGVRHRRGRQRPATPGSVEAGAECTIGRFSDRHRVKSPDRIRRACAEALSLFVLPVAAALLPWRLGFAWLKRRAGRDRLHDDDVAAAWSVARRYLDDEDEGRWKRQHRLIRLVEQVDSYLAILRSDRWWRNQVVVTGAWPVVHGPMLMLTFHWGAGYWIWRILRSRGIHAHFVARRPGPGDLGGSRISLYYARLRTWAMRRVGSAGPLFTGGSTPLIEAAFAEGRSVMGMLDLPAGGSRRTRHREVLGHPLRMPSGLVDLAVRAGVPVVLVSCGLDPTDGRRRLHLETLPADADADRIVSRYAAHLDRCLNEEPAYWQIWSAAQDMFDPPAP
jgi:hypothetical protein